MTRNDFEARIKAEIRRCMTVASKRWPEHNFPFPTVKWNNRKTATTAGSASGSTWTLKFATQMLMDNPDEIEETAAHEFAHLTDYRTNNGWRYVYKTRKQTKTPIPNWKIEECPPYLRRVWFKEQGIVRDVHGEHFKSIMRLFGKSEARCHSMKPIARKTTKRYNYKCSCVKGCTVGPKHNKIIQSGAGRITCRGCKTYLTPRAFNRVLVGNRQDGWKPVGYKTRVTVARKPGKRKITKTVTRKPKMPKAGTKMARAVELVRAWESLPRKATIKLLAFELGMSHAGAQTYYYNARKILK